MTNKQFNESVTDSIRNLATLENRKQGVWDEKSQTFIKPSGTVQQGRRPMFKPFVPDNFSEWLASNSDSIEMPLDRTEATCQWFDNKAKNERPF